jgi:hypothetical protein
MAWGGWSSPVATYKQLKCRRIFTWFSIWLALENAFNLERKGVHGGLVQSSERSKSIANLSFLIRTSNRLRFLRSSVLEVLQRFGVRARPILFDGMNQTLQHRGEEAAEAGRETRNIGRDGQI